MLQEEFHTPFPVQNGPNEQKLRKRHRNVNDLINRCVLKIISSCWALVAHTRDPSYLEAKIWRLKVPGRPRQIVPETPISKTTKAKWTGVVAQAVEHLLCKCEALSSNPSPIKKKKGFILM
jgi:hypothetical protein